MKFSEILDQARELLQRKGRITYRTLKLEFDLDDERLDVLKDELIEGQRLAVDEDGKVLVWTGGEGTGEPENRRIGEPKVSPQSPTPNSQPPVSYTPAHLAERIRAEQAALEARGVTEGERKTITALFADLKGSTALIEGLDPEEARAILDPALQLMMDAVHRYEGYVAQALGDGIFALFGAPIAHEDHPQRALYAALLMQEQMRRYSDQVRLKHGVPLQMRVGVNTGEVVVRSIRKDDLHTDYVPVGHSTNLAARMEQMANPGSIVISEYTRKLTEGYFELKALGAAAIKGVEAPLNVYEVLGAGPLRTRLQVSARRGLTRFVGRQSELDQMQKALEQAKAGHGQIVGVMGEPGLGKSRLFYEFKLLSLGGCLVLEAYSVSHGKATAYLPVIELLKTYFRIEQADDERTRREKVLGKVLGLDRSLEDTLPYLFALLGIEEQPSLLAQMDAQIRRKRTFESLKKLFLRESLNQPLVLIFEDLHWIDGETQGFLDVLSESIASAKLLLLTNYRPEYRHEWGQKTYYTQLRLAPFGKQEAEEFLDLLLGASGSPLPRGERDRERVTENNLSALKQLILEKTQGTPFFMEEIVQELREQGVLPVGATGRSPLPTDLHIPSTVQGILAARIDRLAPDEKALVQQLAVIGRQFPMSLIRQVISQPEAELYRLLASLQHKEFLYEQPAFPESEYIFKHALTQEVAYGTVLQEQRKLLHERTAQAIEQLFHDRLEEHYDELAHHYQRSGNAKKAVHSLHLAGQQAAQRSANFEATSHLTAALELLASLPATSAHAQQELSLLTSLGPVLMATKGFAAPEVGAIYARARTLCQLAEDPAQVLSVFAGLRVFYQVKGEHRTSQDLAEQGLALAQRSQDPTFLLAAYRGLTASTFPRGDFVAAREYAERGIALYNPQRHRALGARYGGIDLGVTCLSYLPYTLWMLGYPTQGEQRLREALALARDLAHPFGQGFAQTSAVNFYWYRRDIQTTQEQAETLITLCTTQGFPQWLACGNIVLGSMLAVQHQGEEGIRKILDGLAALQATGAGLMLTSYLGALAEAYGKTGATTEGLRLVEEALSLADKSDERFWEAELYRLKGELTLQQWKVESQKSKVPNPNPQPLTPSTQAETEAEACFFKAIDVARHQQAKSLELRAVMSLVRLRQQQALGQSAKSKEIRAGSMQHATRAKLDEARQMLAEVYNWFTEGFDTKDLKDAKTLLDELASSSVEA